ncbi:alpha/beta hydrolase family esterase [Streptomyces radicis]|uniref:Poly(3-hydroxybutyrate) depolymerase n=1 Tax=Streptomyces radicis TaxID=1750517 RepID=A0A3A9WDX1_9ACTN|nr:PHB depolymerase family esterase [Streptomyces radicis]RKN10852.1 poly(3-hydroxybutyrate) depolymerase [Streptomyces radicis]RKN25116.1 poly(3-hydroxybutyrate) depolymerase [Streptomyces radicis]
MKRATKRTRPRLLASAATALTGLTLLGGPLAPPATAATTATAAPPATAGTNATNAEATGRGCRLPAPQEPGTSADHTLASGGLARGYRLHLPEDYASRRGWPVVLAFHGRGNTGAGTEEFSKLSTLPAVVVYPEGVVGTGDGDRQAWQGAPYAAPGVDDVAFTADLLDALTAALCVDERRVYATGKSNGAGFAALLACRMADRVAAIAPVAGAYYPGTGEGCAPSRPVPVIAFHGTGDVTIPYGGDADRGLPAISGWVAAWAGRNGCAADPFTRAVKPDIAVSRWVGCERGARVEHVAVADGGHTWPGADSYSGGGVTTQTIEAHEELWRFVRGHRLPAAASASATASAR